MAISSVIEHQAKRPMVMIREDLLIICGGNQCAAAILNYIIYRTNGALINKFSTKFKLTYEELGEGLLNLYERKAIGVALELLADLKYVTRQRKTNGYIYELCATVVNQAIKVHYALIGMLSDVQKWISLDTGNPFWDFMKSEFGRLPYIENHLKNHSVEGEDSALSGDKAAGNPPNDENEKHFTPDEGNPHDEETNSDLKAQTGKRKTTPPPDWEVRPWLYDATPLPDSEYAKLSKKDKNTAMFAMIVYHLQHSADSPEGCHDLLTAEKRRLEHTFLSSILTVQGRTPASFAAFAKAYRNDEYGKRTLDAKIITARYEEYLQTTNPAQATFKDWQELYCEALDIPRENWEKALRNVSESTAKNEIIIQYNRVPAARERIKKSRHYEEFKRKAAAYIGDSE